MIVTVKGQTLNVCVDFTPEEDATMYDPPVEQQVGIAWIMDTYGNDVTEKYLDDVLTVLAERGIL